MNFDPNQICFIRNYFRIWLPLYIDDTRIFSKYEKELETILQTIRISNQNIGMELRIEKFAILIWGKKKENSGRDRNSLSWKYQNIF